MEYKIIGEDMQTLHVKLNSGERFYANPGHIVKKDTSISVNGKSAGGGKAGLIRAVTGTGIFLAEFSAQNAGEVVLSGTLPGKIVSFDLKEGEEIIVEHFACPGSICISEVPSISISITLPITCIKTF